MKAHLHISSVLTLLALSWAGATAQSSHTQQLLVLLVPDLNSVSLAAGAVTVTIRPLDEMAGSDTPVPDAHVRLLWTVTGENRKITVAIDRTPVRPALSLIPQDITPGAAVARVDMTPLAEEPKDFLVDVSRSAGSCMIRFDASGGFPGEAESAVHRVTYTVTGG